MYIIKVKKSINIIIIEQCYNYIIFLIFIGVAVLAAIGIVIIILAMVGPKTYEVRRSIYITLGRK